MKIERALISVSDKKGIAEFAERLSKAGIEIISSGGTYKALKKAGIDCKKIEEITNFPEMLDGRMKTLHPLIHGGILAKRNKEHLKQIQEQGIGKIDLVVVNLYPFKETVLKNPSLEEAIENIDIGGPTLIRSAAKNYENVGVITNPEQYEKIIHEIEEKKSISEETLKKLALDAFAHTAFYDSIIFEYLNNQFKGDKFPKKKIIAMEKVTELRYGENPHQEAALYADSMRKKNSIIDAEQLNGKELSFNNINDSNAAIEIIKEFSETTVVIVKHANPCGVASHNTLKEAFRLAFESDSVSAFGGIIVMNKKCDLETAEQITSFFNEVVIAPDYEEQALEKLKTKKNLRVLRLSGISEKENSEDYKRIENGFLIQDRDKINNSEWDNKTGIELNEKDKRDLEFAWKVVKNVKSNAIVLAKNKATIGLGIGQTSRVNSVKIALAQAGGKASGSVMSSDAFFPFPDSIELAAEAGVKAIAEPGGAMKDDQVIEKAKEKQIALLFTKERHFKH